MTADVTSSAVEKEEHVQANHAVASSSTSGSRLPPYLQSTTSKPADLPRAYLNGTQDMLSLFGLMPIYDRAVRPYNSDTTKTETATSTSINAPASTSNATHTGVAVAGTCTTGGVATQSTTLSATAPPGNATPRPGNPPTGGATTGGLASQPSQSSQPSTGRISTPAFQFNGGAPTLSLQTDSSAILAASPGQLAASAASAPPARKPTKPPPTYAHYVDDLAGRVHPPSKRMRAAKADKGASLISILFKPEYTPQRIVPFDRETMQAAFSVEPGPVAEIDQALLEPDEEDVKPRKKKKKNRQQEGAAAASIGPPSAARTPIRR
ncbi:uncharacterized protein MEPE_01505 [Melanopsichium pennsylvanicum]|uniref:Uncharacterized protein n=2 Tax=Melanopsichium pennsylvanicum TaxID=63383 RepID=A0AAJ5C3T5_9BASI|nr:hypothetical protein BN887_01565 [Melanopsichium pennsylvanicum 4]SNX82799.1 uncharacterized protein MEPE_01505 [Melanopsichium pennsylvanicum]